MTTTKAFEIIRPLVLAQSAQHPPTGFTAYHFQKGSKIRIFETIQFLQPYIGIFYDTFYVIDKTKGPAVITRIGDTSNIRVEYLESQDYEWIQHHEGKITGDGDRDVELEIIEDTETPQEET